MFELTAAFLFDLWLGDPVYRFHPVRLMGNFIERGEIFLRKTISNEKLAGAFLAVLLPVTAAVLAWFLIRLLSFIHPALGTAAEVFGIYSAISVHDLKKEALMIYADLGKSDLPKARVDLGRIVGRDTVNLSQKEVIRASVETVAESTLDGIVAPLFFAALGGAPLALAYKAVNTLDSMIGHKNERYTNFGFFAAKLDEAANWIPARLSFVLSSLAAFFVTGRFSEAVYAGKLHGISGNSGNGAIPEATFAGALGLQLGGPSTYYGGKVVEKPLLGFPKKDFDREDILASIQLMIATAWITLGFAVLYRWLWRFF